MTPLEEDYDPRCFFILALNSSSLFEPLTETEYYSQFRPPPQEAETPPPLPPLPAIQHPQGDPMIKFSHLPESTYSSRSGDAPVFTAPEVSCKTAIFCTNDKMPPFMNLLSTHNHVVVLHVTRSPSFSSIKLGTVLFYSLEVMA